MKIRKFRQKWFHLKWATNVGRGAASIGLLSRERDSDSSLSWPLPRHHLVLTVHRSSGYSMQCTSTPYILGAGTHYLTSVPLLPPSLGQGRVARAAVWLAPLTLVSSVCSLCYFMEASLVLPKHFLPGMLLSVSQFYICEVWFNKWVLAFWSGLFLMPKFWV